MSTENEYTPEDDAEKDTRIAELEARIHARDSISFATVLMAQTIGLPEYESEAAALIAAHDAEAAAKALEGAADIAETGGGTEAEAWADWLRRRAAALRASSGTNQ